jgi:hypothetical protein
MSSDDTQNAADSGETDPRVIALRKRLNEALFDVNHGEYFRSRVHGWAAYVGDVDVELPARVAERLGTKFVFERDEDTGDLAAVDAFVIAYHAAETFWRYLFGVLDGSGPLRAPLVSMVELKAGKAFNERITKYLELGEPEVHQLLKFAFLPAELEATWEGAPSLDEVREYLVLWWQALARFVTEWRNAYNSAKHGLAVGVRPVQLSFLGAEEGSGPPVDFMNGPVMRTLEHEPRVDADGRRIKDVVTGQPVLRWFWMYRAIDPDELIAQAIVTADLLDWLRAIAGSRLLDRTGTPIHVRDEPKPQTLKKRTAPGITFRMDLAAVPLPPEQAAAVMTRLLKEEEEAREGERDK